nr:alpha/beta hydrolase [uncultured Roseateles sp.]
MPPYADPKPDPAWLDAQYNNRARVADSADIFQRWQHASALSRERSPCRLDLAYGDGPDERLDLFAAPRAGAPVLVFLHGGYWRSLDKADHSFVAPPFVADGALVVVPNYSLCPAVSMDRILLQAAQALAWTYRNATLYGGDPQRIVVIGHSAGGQLAAMLLCCLWPLLGQDLPDDLVKGAMSISGLHDLEPLRRSPYLQGDLRLTPALVRKLSPVKLPAPTAPLYALVGGLESEEFLRQNLLIRRAWGARAVPVCEAVADCNHLTILHDLADPRGRSHLLVNELLGLDA